MPPPLYVTRTWSAHVLLRTSVILALSLGCVAGSDANEDLWLIGLVPFTSFGWDAGSSLRVGAELMLEAINADETLLPGYNLRIVWEDEQCTASIARDILLRNLVEEVYYSYGEGHVDTDGDGLISTEESLLLQEEWNSSEVTTSPVALLGAGCSSSSMDINVVAYRFSLPIISPGSSNSALSDRSSYPNFFRTLAPDSDYLKGWCNLLQALSVSKVFLIVGETSVFGVNLERLVAVAGEASIELLGDDLTSEVAGLYGYQISSDSWSSAQEALEAVRNTRARFVGAQMYDPRFRLLLCAAVKQELSTLVWLVGSVVAAGFWLRTDQTEISGLEWCTAEVVTKAANGVIQGNVAFWRSDSDTALTCGNGLTAGEFKTKFYTEQKVDVGSDSLSELGWYVMGEGACSADAVCMYAQALHTLLVTNQLGREELTEHYDDFVDLLGNSDFEGLQGRLTYEPGNPDPAGILTYYQVQSSTAPCAGQTQCSAEVSWTMVGLQAPSSSVIEFVAPMMFHFPEEVWEASGLTAQLSPSLDALFPECETGLVYDFLSRECGSCPENQTFLELTSTCVCSVGYYSATSGCEACPAGSYSASVGSTACTDCARGQFSDSTGLSVCERCPKATYANTLGSTKCTSCPGVTITDGTGFAAATDCQCSEGYFDSSVSSSSSSDSSSAASRSDPICTPCGKGASCSGFGAAPQARAGYELDAIYWSNSGQEPGLSLFECQDPSRCPGGGLRVCAEGREGIGCSLCEPGLSASNDGTCKPCDGEEVAVAICTSVFFTALITVVYVRSRKSLERLARGSLGFILTAAQLVAALQTLSVVALINLEWPDFLRDLFSALQLLSFDLDVNCFNQPDPVMLYALKLGLLPAGVLYIFVLHICWSCGTCDSTRKSELSSLVGPLGSIASALFISLCVTILAPFQCVDHPNGKWTLMKYESQLCWETQHYAMIAMGSVAVVVPIAFVVVVAYATCQFPRRMALGDTRFLQKFEFVFIRFKPEYRWMTLIYLVRNLAISLTPVIPSPFSQLVVLYAIFLASGVVNAWCAPWKLTNHSIIEVCLNSVFSSFILISMRFVEMPSTSVCVGLTLALLGVSVSGMVLYCSGNLYAMFAHRYLTRPKYYKFFLCHHKAAAGAVARLLKMVLADTSPGRVFLDSDDLLDLRSLFDTVSEEVETLVVLCTQELLLRPYCLGEITTSYVDEVHVAPVFLSFDRPSDDFIECIKESVDLQCLSEVGLSLQLVKNALQWFRNLEGLKYPSSSSLPDLMSLCQKLGQGNGVGSLAYNSSDTLGKSAGLGNLICELLLTSDGSNPNALASATILQKFLGAREMRAYTFHELMLSPISLDFEKLAFRCMAVVCTGGCWTNDEFLLSFRTATDMKAPCLAVIADDTFNLPNLDICDTIRAQLAKDSDEATVSQVLETITFTFKLIALPLAVNGSWPTLQTQCTTICERLVALTTLKARSEVGLTLTHASSMALQQSNRSHRAGSKGTLSSIGRLVSRARSRDEDSMDSDSYVGKMRSAKGRNGSVDAGESTDQAPRKLSFEDEGKPEKEELSVDFCFGSSEAAIDLDAWSPRAAHNHHRYEVSRSTL